MQNHSQEDPLFTIEEACAYRNLHMKTDNNESSSTFGQKIPDIESFKKFVRNANFPFVPILGREEGRNRMYRKSDLDNFIDGHKGDSLKPASISGLSSKQPNADLDKVNADIQKTQVDIELLGKAEELHKKSLEYNALRTGFKTAEEYQQALDNLKVREDGLKAMEVSLNEQEHIIKAREIVIKDREDTIEAVCNEKLTECQNTCDNMIEDTKKQCGQMVARRKEEVKKQENSEFENMEQALHEIEDINLTIHEYGFDGYGEQIDVMIDRIIYCLNNNFTLLELRDDFKYTTDVINEVLETTQNRKDANKFVDFRNQIGKQVKNIMIKLHLDDNRLQPPSKFLAPLLPSD